MRTLLGHLSCLAALTACGPSGPDPTGVDQQGAEGTACSESTHCAAANVCVLGTCALGLPRTYELIVHSARLPGAGAPPNASVCFYVYGSQTGLACSAAVQSFQPRWDERFEVRVDEGTQVILTAWDGASGAPQALGSITWPDGRAFLTTARTGDLSVTTLTGNTSGLSVSISPL